MFIISYIMNGVGEEIEFIDFDEAREFFIMHRHKEEFENMKMKEVK